jgi:hypothetical protein
MKATKNQKDDFEEFNFFGMEKPEESEEVYKVQKDELNPFMFIESVSKTKKELIKNSDQPSYAEKQYNPYIVNIGLSLFADTILHANEMNRLHHLSKDAQYRYYLGALKPRDRRSKWHKASKDSDLDNIQQVYQCNRTVAKQYLKVLSKEDIEKINSKVNKGGS